MKHNLWTSLNNSIDDFSLRLLTSLDELGIRDECEKISIDHVCVRLSDASQVDQLREELSEVGQDISTVEVNGRLISIFQLNQPLTVGSWRVFGVEVPYPKQNHNYSNGWEHVEFVLPTTGNTMLEIRDAFTKFFLRNLSEVEKEMYQYSENEPHTAAKQLPNPTISLKVNGIGIKFHAYSIQQVVGFQKIGVDSGLI